MADDLLYHLYIIIVRMLVMENTKIEKAKCQPNISLFTQQGAA